MHIKVLLFFGNIFLCLFILFALYERTNLCRRSNYNLINSEGALGLWLRGLYLLLFAGITYAAILTVKTYFFPTDEKVFRNVDYHVLSHKGYEVGDAFYLANGYTSENDGYPAVSLWDNKDGKVLLNGTDSCLVISEFIDPIYIRKDTHKAWWQFWKDDWEQSYHLVNSIVREDISKGFVLVQDNDTVYELLIEPKDDSHNLYISKVYKGDHTCITDTSSFTRTIQQGYPILDIIAKSPRIAITDDLERWFEDAYLVRKEIPMKGYTSAFNPKHPSPLYLMPGLSFYLNGDLKINGVHYDFFKKTFVVPFSDYANNGKVTFFSGLGKRRTEDFRLSFIDNNRMRLEFLRPDMKQIKDTLGRVFINSSIDDVSKESLDGGYLYNKFANEDNHNHVKAHFQYCVGDARSEMPIKVFDFNKSSDDFSQELKSNSEFLLCSRAKTKNAASWIFEVTDLRETNSLQCQDIVIFILIMFIMVALRVWTDSFFERNTLSLTEMAIYVVLFSLCVIRLILGWRASTFVPVEDISLPMFNKMRLSILDLFTWLVALLPLFIAISVEVWKRWKGNSRLLEKTMYYLSNPSVCLSLFVLMLIISYILGKHISSLNRLCNIPLPILSYFIFEIWMNRLSEHGTRNTKIFISIAIFVLFGYLFFADAGFTIIFLSYMIVHHIVLGYIYSVIKDHNKSKLIIIIYYLISLSSAFALFFILKKEGEIMILLFHNVTYLVAIISIILFLFVFWNFIIKRRNIFLIKNELLSKMTNNLFRGAAIVICFLFCIVSILDVLQVSHPLPTVSSILNGKAHMRYRAEVQRLGGDQKIDDLILQSEFDSNDIVFILRSAHNQWFINQYIRAGKELEQNDVFFHIQPHSNQGASYTTQTTDLVVTRYLLAEHGEIIVRYYLFLWFLLILIFVIEFKISDYTNILFLNGPILIFIISLMVYLSATNRIVFVGQDLPLISLQSRVAILFPLFLLSLLLGRCLYLRSIESFRDSPETSEIFFQKLVFPGILILFTWGCFNCIEQKGKDQEESQFNVSRLISDLSIKVDDINEKFEIFQENNSKSLERKTIKEIWELFAESDNKVYRDYLNPETPNFFSSLLHYFNEKQTSKTDMNQLLHLRRRGKKCYLALNKQHYFIPSIMNEESRWFGDVYAAQVESEMMLFERNNRMINIDETKDYEKNIFSPKIQGQTPNMPLMYFSKEWTPNDKPLFLISSKQSQNYSEFFHIETDTLEINGDGYNNQIATSVLPGDVLSLYKKQASERNAIAVMKGNMSEDGTPYLVRNMWLNGHKRLFFPLGKQSMWTYHFGNMVSDVFSKNPELKDTSLYLSLDYNLMKTLYGSINKQISNRVSPPRPILNILSEFNKKTYEQQCDPRNIISYDKKNNKIIVKQDNANRNYNKAAALINKELKRTAYFENPLSKALQKVLKTQYDFTAVAIDGDGHIRALFDYSRNRHLDPNNGAHLSKVISELYQDGSSADERDIFGSKALQHIPSGPGSSFKPIVYTSITSQKKLNWESIDLKDIGMIEARAIVTEATESGSRPYAYYGGVNTMKEKGLNIQGGVINHNLYLVKSNNLYHSVIVLLGMQNAKYVKDVMRPYTSDIEKRKAFPVFTYNNTLMCFDPNVWYDNRSPQIEDNDMLTEGLLRNFHIKETAPRLSVATSQLFGNDKLVNALYEDGISSRNWVFPEISSLNNADRNQSLLRYGFNQILLGANPLQLTPLQMAVNASRLASLNRTENISTILDGKNKNQFEFFDLGDDKEWSEEEYLKFMKDQVWTQLRNVPKTGTAKALVTLANEMEKGDKYGRPYYLYCKTGTLEDDRPGESNEDRMKHLLVIITDRPLENVNNVEELKQVRYYVLYLSFLGINHNEFTPEKFRPYIIDVLNSNSFNQYMNE